MQDFAQEACKWVREFIPEDNIHGRDFIDAQNPVKFDLVYLSAIAYALPDAELIDFLIKLKRFIKPTGKIVLVSSGFYENKSYFHSVLYNVKHTLKLIFKFLHLYNCGQFWGWLRNQKEFKGIMESSGYLNIQDGFINNVKLPSIAYYIEGKIQQ